MGNVISLPKKKLMLLTTNILWMRRRIQQTQHPTSQLEQVSDDEPCYIPGTIKPKRLTARAWRKEMGKRTMKTSNSISHFEVLIPADTLKPLVNMDPHMVVSEEWPTHGQGGKKREGDKGSLSP
jgi:hypothetical protein